MNLSKLIELANGSGGTLYLMAVLLLVELTVIFERMRHLSSMEGDGRRLIAELHGEALLPAVQLEQAAIRHAGIPHAALLHAALLEGRDTPEAAVSGHLEEVMMHEAPRLDRSLWVLDTVITLAPLLGLFGTIIGMFRAFSVLGDVANGAGQVTGGIAEALLATACGLFIAMIGLVFFNLLNTKVRTIVHQLDTLKVMLINRRVPPDNAGRSLRIAGRD